MPYYFTKKTQEAIIEYNKSKSLKKKNEIFNKSINTAFEKMVENLIFSMKLRSKLQNHDTLKFNTIGDLVLKIHLFNENKISKLGVPVRAFSFFNTIAKNFILMELKKEARTESLQDLESDLEREKNSIDTRIILDRFSVTDDVNEKNEFRKIVLEFLKDEQENSEFSIDEKILDAIEYAFRNCYETGIKNKKGLFLYLREFTGLTTTEISEFLTRFRKRLKNQVTKYNNGEM